VLLFFAAAALTFVSGREIVANWQPFFPNGWSGTLTGAAIVFFAYVGFDSLSTVAEETRDPGRNLPRGIIASLIVCTVLYLAVTGVFTGIMPYDVLARQIANDQAEPLTLALRHVAPQHAWAEGVIALGAVVAQTAAILVYQIAQPRILYVMARDGLLPPVFARMHPRFKTPHVATWATGAFVAGVSAFASIDEMVDLTNIGTLFAFTIVCIGVPVLRLTDPHRERPFRVPLGAWLVPSLGAGSCIFLMWFLPPASWWRFVGWLMLGLGVYMLYGYTRSTLGRQRGRPQQTSLGFKLAGGVLTLASLVLLHSALLDA
ncbi:MAG TPA: amino acid permease, partial [Myxococcota bacterium]|nr:amino acid permease [Myxococcota bacterium]